MPGRPTERDQAHDGAGSAHERAGGPSPSSRAVPRADGVTESERYLKTLCDRTFLSLWSYPGVYRDQGRPGKGDGKEVCDLLVVFENHVIRSLVSVPLLSVPRVARLPSGSGVVEYTDEHDHAL